MGLEDKFTYCGHRDCKLGRLLWLSLLYGARVLTYSDNSKQSWRRDRRRRAFKQERGQGQGQGQGVAHRGQLAVLLGQQLEGVPEHLRHHGLLLLGVEVQLGQRQRQGLALAPPEAEHDHRRELLLHHRLLVPTPHSHKFTPHTKLNMMQKKVFSMIVCRCRHLTIITLGVLRCKRHDANATAQA